MKDLKNLSDRRDPDEQVIEQKESQGDTTGRGDDTQIDLELTKKGTITSAAKSSQFGSDQVEEAPSPKRQE